MTKTVTTTKNASEAFIQLLISAPIMATIDDHEKSVISELDITPHHYPADTIIIHQGDRIRCIHLIQNGWGCVYRDLSNGQRQILDFPMRSDFVGLRSAEGYSYNTITSITEINVFKISLCSLEKGILKAPKLGLILIELFARQRSLLTEHLTNLGCRSALVRTAHLLLELGDRAKACGMADASGYNFPFAQHQLADALGLTPIHLNRMLRELRENKLVIFRNNYVEFLDRKNLVDLAEYDGEFLNMSVF